MSKFGLYTKSHIETTQYINTVDVPTISQAEAYFAGVKRLTLEQFRNIFVVKEINNKGTHLMFGNQ